jgi:hypothetical protein
MAKPAVLFKKKAAQSLYGIAVITRAEGSPNCLARLSDIFGKAIEFPFFDFVLANELPLLRHDVVLL